MKNSTDQNNFDVIIVGGSYAGLSAAMALGRSLRKVLVIDGGSPCNRQTPHSHNFITQDGETPHAIAAKAKAQVLKYTTVKFLDGIAIDGKKNADGFSITTQAGAEFMAKKLIFATGIKDTMPDIKGFDACWGISVVHCPYCHGYELRGQNTGIMANGAKAMHLASLVSNLTNKITILTNGTSELTEEQRNKLQGHAIDVIETALEQVDHENGQVKSVTLRNGHIIHFDALYAALPFTQHSDIPVTLGCELTDQGYIKTDAFQKTTVAGVFACGDNAAMMRSVANAVYGGNITGAMVNKELTEERF